MDVQKREDQFLDVIAELIIERDTLLLELEQYRTVVPAQTPDPAHV